MQDQPRTPKASRLRSMVAALAVVALATFGLAACSESLDRDAAVQDMIDIGLTEDQANCAVDAMIDEFGEDRLISDDDPTDEEAAKIFEIIAECTDG